MKVCSKCFTEAPDETRFCPNCGEAMPADEDSQQGLIGKTIAGKFRILEMVGEGAMGSIYKAEQTTLAKLVCIKVLHPHLSGDKTLSKRFHREARAASRIKHPNAIGIIDFGTADDGTHYIAMDFIDGRDLAHFIKKEFPLDQDRSFTIINQICSALDDAHAQGVIHRDLKPENIMLEDRRHQKDFVTVLDFGIAKILDPSGESQETFHTMAGIVCGTPEYMSPEQARGEALDARSDIYSLGVIMYQMFTGKLPFTADTPIGVVTKHLTQQPQRPREIRPELHPALEKLILTLMSKDRAKRPETCMGVTELIEGFREALKQDPNGRSTTAPMLQPADGEDFSNDETREVSDPAAITQDVQEDDLIPPGAGAGMKAVVAILALIIVGGGGYFAYDRFVAGSGEAAEETAEKSEAQEAREEAAEKGSEQEKAVPGKGENADGTKDDEGQQNGASQEEVLRLVMQMQAHSRKLQEFQLIYAENDRMLYMRLEEWKRRDQKDKVEAITELMAQCTQGKKRIRAIQDKVDSGQLDMVKAEIEVEAERTALIRKKAQLILMEELPTIAGQEDLAGKRVEELTGQIGASRKELADLIVGLEEKKAAWAETPDTKNQEALASLANSVSGLDKDYQGLVSQLDEKNVSTQAIQYGKLLGKHDVFKLQVETALAREVGPTTADLKKQADEDKRRADEKKRRDEERKKSDSLLAMKKAEENKKKAALAEARKGEEDKKKKAAAAKKKKAEAKAKGAELTKLGDDARSQGSYAKALLYYKQALKTAPNASLHKKLGKTYNSKGDYANGAKHLKTYLKKAGSSLSATKRKLIESQIRE